MKKRQATISISLTPAHLHWLHGKAADMGISCSAIVRLLINMARKGDGELVPEPEPKPEPKPEQAQLEVYGHPFNLALKGVEE